ncbi:OLC1v1023091C1 [Oldenlandia corymbosa var. corymbosa]|uniref:OLC1v1023091C1 n=1 Tax=Oldenlandia corymbosa var. corymbosa TaxID=529605 RepID=A0AAV1BZX1_OLDCO|nr:OLC1v1023091C1 [Oldenlandia corymbosa var. corymbosa]
MVMAMVGGNDGVSFGNDRGGWISGRLTIGMSVAAVVPKPFSTSTNHLGNSGSLACHLKTRSVIRFKGPDTVNFLRGLVTNDLRRLGGCPESSFSSATAPPLYTAVLNPEGRFLFDMFLYRRLRPDAKKVEATGSAPGELELLADVDSSFLDELGPRLRLKELQRISAAGKDLGLNSHKSSTDSTEADSKGMDGNGILIPDVMSLDIGLFFLLIQPATPLVEVDKQDDERHFILWRLDKGIPEGSSENSKRSVTSKALPLQCNLAGLNAISFDKGCYVGREMVDTRDVGVVPKRMLPLKFLNANGNEVEDKVAPKTDVIDETSGKKVGTITAELACRGLGLLQCLGQTGDFPMMNGVSLWTFKFDEELT